MNPGSKNVAGETLRDALMPLQPVPITAKTGMIAKLRIVQLNLTSRNYRSGHYVGNN